MSIETWKAEFYPVPAGKVSKEDALDHSIRKWEGLTKENLDKHGLRKGSGSTVVEAKAPASDSTARFLVDADSCALCRHYIDTSSDDQCQGCPLSDIRDRRCDVSAGEDDFEDGPYGEWLASGDPDPMLDLLDAAKDKQLEEAK